jgi:hypothetical protein
VPADTAPTIEQSVETPQARPRDHAEAARQFLGDYLSYWSRTNVVTRDSASAFYRPMVRFYGRPASLDDVIIEKRRFIDRWPIRDYVVQPETLHSQCDPDRQICKVDGLFSFTASDPPRRRISRGIGRLELGIAFDEERPVIISETSSVVSRSPKDESGDEEGDF